MPGGLILNYVLLFLHIYFCLECLEFSSEFFFFFSSRRRHTRSLCDWSSDVCSSDLKCPVLKGIGPGRQRWRLGHAPAHRAAWVLDLCLSERGTYPRQRWPGARSAPGVQIGRASCRERG